MAVVPVVPAAAQNSTVTAGRTDRVDRAVERGAAFLLSRQNAGGAFHHTGRDHHLHLNATTSLAVLALASAGHQPIDPTRQGRAMHKALGFILRDDRTDEKGYFGKVDDSRMYGHGITTLMLAEMTGMGTDRDTNGLIRRRCKGAIDLIVKGQSTTPGGWRYKPGDKTADLSVTAWQVMALRAAKNAGFDVPSETIAASAAFVKSLHTQGGFVYSDVQLRKKEQPRFATTAMGLAALWACGHYDAVEADRAAGWLRNHPPKPGERYLLYGTYYYAQAMYQRGAAGDPDEENARQAQQIVENLLVRLQKDDGSWFSDEAAQCRTYGTAMAILSLAVRYHYLPIYQR